VDPLTQNAADVQETYKQVLAILRQVWPRRFPYEDEASQLTLFRRATKGISLDCVVEAAEEYSVTNQYAPTPAALAEIARKLHRSRYPTQYLEPPREASPLPDEIVDYRHTVEERLARINAKAHWVWEQLAGDRAKVAEYFALLWTVAPNPDAVAAIQNGRVRRSTMAEVLERYRNGERGKDIPKTPRSAPPQPDADVPVDAPQAIYAG
jgi:hypothetical protein